MPEEALDFLQLWTFPMVNKYFVFWTRRKNIDFRKHVGNYEPHCELQVLNTFKKWYSSVYNKIVFNSISPTVVSVVILSYQRYMKYLMMIYRASFTSVRSQQKVWRTHACLYTTSTPSARCCGTVGTTVHTAGKSQNSTRSPCPWRNPSPW